MSQFYPIDIITTTAFDDQKPGTSGLRKPTKNFEKLPNYLQNFVQSILDAVDHRRYLVIGGDGRYYNSEAIKIIIKMCAANAVRKVVVGRDGLLSTPAASAYIRNNKIDGGIILTASHNPGGPNGDFGIKYNISNGGPAPEILTNAIYEKSRKIVQYKQVSNLEVPLGEINSYKFMLDNSQEFQVEIIDPISDYLVLLKQIFDFDRLRSAISQGWKSSFVFDSMHGVTGPYVQKIFGEELGIDKDNLLNTIPKPDFNEGHPDPNLTYATDLIKKMSSKDYILGVAFDGDGDRNMILGTDAYFVTPGDSLAIIAANAKMIPYFKKYPLRGVARSMPTSPAIDKVAESLNIPCHEVPTGWKYFGNLMDSGKISLCGEESFGTGANHIREKDGIWAALCWMTILAENYLSGDKSVSVKKIVERHWEMFGRNAFLRFDYENCHSKGCNLMMDHLQTYVRSQEWLDRTFENTDPAAAKSIYVVADMDNFQYIDPVDNSISRNQGIRILFKCGSRIIVRISGTGSTGVTVRLYMNTYVRDLDHLYSPASVLLKPLVKIAKELTRIEEFTGRSNPTVIT